MLRQKLSNIPEKSLLRHNRKSIRAYDNKLQYIMISQTSSPNIAIKSCKQPSSPETVEDRRTYWKRIVLNIPN